MPRKPRGTRPEIAEIPKAGRAPLVTTQKVTTQPKLYYRWLCPVCGKAHGMRVTRKVKYFPIERKPYVESIDWLPEKPFGVIVVYEGRGKGVTVMGYFQPGQDPDNFFPAVKERFVNAIKEWLDKGWLKDSDLKALLP